MQEDSTKEQVRQIYADEVSRREPLEGDFMQAKNNWIADAEITKAADELAIQYTANSPITDLTKREYFTAQALTLWSIDATDSKRLQRGEPPDHALVAKFCVGLADAIIEELNKSEINK